MSRRFQSQTLGGPLSLASVARLSVFTAPVWWHLSALHFLTEWSLCGDGKARRLLRLLSRGMAVLTPPESRRATAAGQCRPVLQAGPGALMQGSGRERELPAARGRPGRHCTDLWATAFGELERRSESVRPALTFLMRPLRPETGRGLSWVSGLTF